MELCDLILATLPALESFSYSGYPPAFAAFEQEAAPFFDSLRAVEVEARAASLITELEKVRGPLGRREAKKRAGKEKQVLALFLAPAAQRYGEAAQRFAEELSRLWNARYPRNRFYPGSYETIMKGFDANLLGLPLRKSK